MVSRAIVFGIDYTIWADHIDRPMLLRARERGKIKCLCGKPLTFVDSIIKLAHFRHLKGNCLVIGAERDTQTHNEGLEYLGQTLRKVLRQADVEKEETFRIHRKKRRTDIFVKFRTGATICYELQCSSIPQQEFANRTIAYHSLGHEVVWIFGPDVSGMKYPQIDSSRDATKSTTVCVKYIALHALRDSGYLTLYFPNQQHRLWIAYCADGRFDRTRDFVLTRGENQFAVSLPEIQATVFPMEFGQDGLPYARAFPIDQLAILKDDLAKSRLEGIYDRELRHLRGEITIPKSRSLPKQVRNKPTKRKMRGRIKNMKGPQCTICGTVISDQHYHKCEKCGRILDDRCTEMIEKALGEKEHNTTGWVRHCDWLSQSKVRSE